MFQKFLRPRKVSPEDIDQVLAQARRQVWTHQYDDAVHLFRQVVTDIEKERDKQGSDQPWYNSSLIKARLGLWAIGYLRNEEPKGWYKKLTARGEIDAETWYFVARVFKLKQDARPDALHAYSNLLKSNPAPKIAQKVVG